MLHNYSIKIDCNYHRQPFYIYCYKVTCFLAKTKTNPKEWILMRNVKKNMSHSKKFYYFYQDKNSSAVALTRSDYLVMVKKRTSLKLLL